jgi:PleD family two-component response regulator
MDRVRTNLLLSSMSAQSPSFTASFGVAVSTDGVTFDEVVARADAALRDAKEAGRDRVVSFDPSKSVRSSDRVGND